MSQAKEINWFNAIFLFVQLHLLVYPSSNGYNSYMDRDTTPIGGLKNPSQPTRQLFYITIAMDLLAIALALAIRPIIAVGILLYILASRAYSYRGIRLKRYPITGFLTVFIFQGFLIYLISINAVQNSPEIEWTILPATTAALLIGALYPLTQIYQHEADKADGVTTISMMLGKKGSFLLSALLFLSATAGIYLIMQNVSIIQFYYFLLIMLPVVLFFLRWAVEVYKNDAAASFINSLRMNVLATVCTTIYFSLIFILNH